MHDFQFETLGVAYTQCVNICDILTRIVSEGGREGRERGREGGREGRRREGRRREGRRREGARE